MTADELWASHPDRMGHLAPAGHSAALWEDVYHLYFPDVNGHHDYSGRSARGANIDVQRGLVGLPAVPYVVLVMGIVL